MADFGRPRVMILGHSFVRRLDQFIRRFQLSTKVDRNFNIQDQCQVSLLGIGGRTVRKIIQNDLAKSEPSLLRLLFWKLARTIYAILYLPCLLMSIKLWDSFTDCMMNFQ